MLQDLYNQQENISEQLSSVRAFSDNGEPNGSFDAEFLTSHPDVRQDFFLLLYMGHMQRILLNSLFELVMFAGSKVKDGTMKSSRLIFSKEESIRSWFSLKTEQKESEIGTTEQKNGITVRLRWRPWYFTFSSRPRASATSQHLGESKRCSTLHSANNSIRIKRFWLSRRLCLVLCRDPSFPPPNPAIFLPRTICLGDDCYYHLDDSDKWTNHVRFRGQDYRNNRFHDIKLDCLVYCWWNDSWDYCFSIFCEYFWGKARL